MLYLAQEKIMSFHLQISSRVESLCK